MEVPFRGVDVDNGGSNSATGDGVGGGNVNDDTVAAIGGGPAPCANRGGDGMYPCRHGDVSMTS